MTRESKLFIKSLSSLAKDEETIFEILPGTIKNRMTGNLIRVDLDDSKQYPFPKFEKHIMGITDYLSQLGYLRFPDESNPTAFTLTYSALHFREISIKNMLHTITHHFLCPVAVSVASSVITTRIVLALKGLL